MIKLNVITVSILTVCTDPVRRKHPLNNFYVHLSIVETSASFHFHKLTPAPKYKPRGFRDEVLSLLELTVPVCKLSWIDTLGGNISTIVVKISPRQILSSFRKDPGDSRWARHTKPGPCYRRVGNK